MRKEIIQAVDALAKLNVGDLIEVTEHGHAYTMTVYRGLHRCDGQFGSYESSRISARIRIGGYSREITAEQIEAGHVSIAKVEA